MEILGFFFMILLVYSFSVLLVEVIKNVSIKEAINTVNDFLVKSIYGLIDWIKRFTAPDEITSRYNIYLGLDNNLNPDSNRIDCIFNNLEKVFQNYYFYELCYDENRIRYRFRVSQALSSMTDEELYEYGYSICDSLVHMELHKMYPTFTSLDNLVAITIHQGYLDVYIAQTPDGQRQNAILTRNMRRIFKTEHTSQDIPITENWNDD